MALQSADRVRVRRAKFGEPGSYAGYDVRDPLELEGRLTDPERAAIAKGQWQGPLRSLLGSAPIRHASGMDVLGDEHLRAQGALGPAILAPVHAGLWDLPRAMVGHDAPSGGEWGVERSDAASVFQVGARPARTGKEICA